MLHQILTLERPLVVIDLEATGSNPLTDRIVQIAITMYRADKDPIEWVQVINPEMTIPAETIAVHRITNEMAAEAPTLRSMAAELARKALTNVDFSGHNVTFDLRLLRAEMQRCSVPWDWEKNGSLIVDTLRIYQIVDPRTLTAAYQRFCKKPLEGAHDAGVDVRATTEVLMAQLEEFPNIPRTVPELAAYCFPRRADSIDRGGKIVWKNGVACIGFGKYGGQSLEVLSKTNKGYLNWILKSDFPPDMKKIITNALAGIYPQSPDSGGSHEPSREPDAEPAEETAASPEV